MFEKVYDTGAVCMFLIVLANILVWWFDLLP